MDQSTSIHATVKVNLKTGCSMNTISSAQIQKPATKTVSRLNSQAKLTKDSSTASPNSNTTSEQDHPTTPFTTSSEDKQSKPVSQNQNSQNGCATKKMHAQANTDKPTPSEHFLLTFYDKFKDIPSKGTKRAQQHRYLQRTLDPTNIGCNSLSRSDRKHIIKKAEEIGDPSNKMQYVFFKLMSQKPRKGIPLIRNETPPGQNQGEKFLSEKHSIISVLRPKQFPKVGAPFECYRIWREGYFCPGFFIFGGEVTRFHKMDADLWFLENLHELWAFRILPNPKKFKGTKNGTFTLSSPEDGALLTFPCEKIDSIQPDFRLEVHKSAYSKTHPKLVYWPYIDNVRLTHQAQRSS